VIRGGNGFIRFSLAVVEGNGIIHIAMDMFEESQLLFSQLASEPDSSAVKTLIENHDALEHGDAALRALDAALQGRLVGIGRDVVTEQRIVAQQRRLAGLVVKVPVRRAGTAA